MEDAQEAMGQFHGSIPCLQIDIHIEATRERRMKKQSESTCWSNMFLSPGKGCLNHKSEKKLWKRECKRKSKSKCK